MVEKTDARAKHSMDVHRELDEKRLCLEEKRIAADEKKNDILVQLLAAQAEDRKRSAEERMEERQQQAEERKQQLKQQEQMMDALMTLVKNKK